MNEYPVGVQFFTHCVIKVVILLDYELITHHLCTQGFCIIDDFLDLQYCQSLRSTAMKQHDEGLFKSSKIGPNIRAQHNNTIRSDDIFWLEEHSSDPAIQVYLEQVMRISHYLNQSLFLGIKELEAHFAAYKPGTFYKRHVDQFATQKTRKISCVYYLNENWQSHYGGELKLYDKADQLIQLVSPVENRFICFNSELPHEVCVTHHPRYSIAGWMKTRSMSESVL